VQIDWARLCQSSLNLKTLSLSLLISKKELKLDRNFFEFTYLKKYLNAASNADHTITFKVLSPAISRDVPDVLGHIFLLRIVLVVMLPSVLTVVKIILLIACPALYLRN